MPKVYRGMYSDGDAPRVGDDAKSLGVRLEGDSADVDMLPDGIVHANGKGMSVSSDWKSLPPHRIPSRLRAKCSKAKGSNNYRCWRYGEGKFDSGAFAAGLVLEIDVDDLNHGFVAPSEDMHKSVYTAHIAATRDGWVVDEE